MGLASRVAITRSFAAAVAAISHHRGDGSSRRSSTSHEFAEVRDVARSKKRMRRERRGRPSLSRGSRSRACPFPDGTLFRMALQQSQIEVQRRYRRKKGCFDRLSVKPGDGCLIRNPLSRLGYKHWCPAGSFKGHELRKCLVAPLMQGFHVVI
jgi:hypothetical protein